MLTVRLWPEIAVRQTLGKPMTLGPRIRNQMLYRRQHAARTDGGEREAGGAVFGHVGIASDNDWRRLKNRRAAQPTPRSYCSPDDTCQELQNLHEGQRKEDQWQAW